MHAGHLQALAGQRALGLRQPHTPDTLLIPPQPLEDDGQVHCRPTHSSRRPQKLRHFALFNKTTGCLATHSLYRQVGTLLNWSAKLQLQC